MSVRIAILVEGATEKAFQDTLRTFLKSRLSGRMPKLAFRTDGPGGRIPKEGTLKRIVELLLNKNDAVIALTDVYTGSNSKDFTDAADAKRKMTEWVGSGETRFHPHAAQHDFEAWLLPYWSRIKSVAGSTRGPPSPHPESVNHGHSPAKVLQDIFMTGSNKRAYSKVRDGTAILRGQDLTVAASACPELKAFLNTILGLSGAPKLE